MKCPDCGKRLTKIVGCCEGEYICENPTCPAYLQNKKEGYLTYPEYYGNTQEEINKMKRFKT